MKPLFLIRDGSKHDLLKIKKFVLPHGHIRTLKTDAELKSLLRKQPAVLILTSAFSEQKIRQYISWAKSVSPHTRILFLIHQNEMSLGRKAIRWGVYAYIVTPLVNIDFVKQLVKNALCEWEYLQRTSGMLSLIEGRNTEIQKNSVPAGRNKISKKEAVVPHDLQTISADICSRLEIRDILTSTKIIMSQLFDYTLLLILNRAETTPKLYILQNYAADDDFVNCAVHSVLKASTAILGKAFPVKDIEWIRENNAVAGVSGKTKPLSIKSNLTFPLVAYGEGIGCACLVSHRPNAFRADATRRFSLVCKSLAAALRNAQLFQATKNLSITDGLTRVYNRQYFDDVMEKEFLRAKRYKHPLALALIDIDNFKEINDTYGHTEGDRILSQFASRVQETIRNTDIFSRYGGEEFSVIMPLTDIEEGIVVMERLRVVIAGSVFPLTSKDIQLTASIGVSSLFDNPVHSAKELIQAADSALYLAKKTGKNRACIYTPEKAGVKSGADVSAEKRGIRRVNARFPVKYLVLPRIDACHRPAVTENISINGLCFETERDNLVRQGAYTMIEIKISTKETPAKRLKILYQVVWSVEKDGKQLIGARLVSSSNDVVDILNDLLEEHPLQQQGVSNHRHRRKCHG